MSSPIHQPEDLDAALRYAPPWARRQSPLSTEPAHASRNAALPRGHRANAGPSEFGGDQAMLRMQRQLALYPDSVPEPPGDGAHSLWPLALRVCGVTGLAAMAAWAIVVLPGTSKPHKEVAPANAPAAVSPVSEVKLEHFRPVANLPPSDSTVDGPASIAPAPVEMLPVPIPPPAPAPADGVLALDGDEIATLVKRGQDLLQNGDLASARLLLQRAAEAGSANAALALGATFDPLVIQRLGVIGMTADIARARIWYQKAAELGSATALQELAKLEQAR
jgi:hypothetical protein